jgi:hypothetical protein
MKWRMKESYMKGLALHRGPVLCAYCGNAAGEVSLDLGRYKLAIELRNQPFWVPAVLICRIGNTLQCVMRKCCGGPAESETLREYLSFMRENRESPVCAHRCMGRLGKVFGRNPNRYATGKSDVGHSTVDNIEQHPRAGCGDAVGKGR